MTDPMPPYSGDPYTAGPAQQGNGLAIAAMVCGIVGLVVAPVILGILALILGFIGLQRANAGARHRGMAIAGLVLGGIDLVIFIILLAAVRNGGFTY